VGNTTTSVDEDDPQHQVIKGAPFAQTRADPLDRVDCEFNFLSTAGLEAKNPDSFLRD
jgi:hypothetical protein